MSLCGLTGARCLLGWCVSAIAHACHGRASQPDHRRIWAGRHGHGRWLLVVLAGLLGRAFCHVADAAAPRQSHDFEDRGRRLQSSSTCCSTVTISMSGAAASFQSSRAGDYDIMLSYSRNGKPVYQQRGGSNYLFLLGNGKWILLSVIDQF